MESLEHLITRSIKAYYKNRIYAPIIYLILLAAVTFFFPVRYMFFPKVYTEDKVSLTAMHDRDETYATFSLEDLYFTGYTSKWLDNTRGYYYYTMIGSDCVVVLMDPKTCDQGNPHISSITIDGYITEESFSTRTLLTNLASDLAWSEGGIMSSVSSFTISEPDFNGYSAAVFKIVFLFTGIFAAVNFILNLFFILCPILSPPVLKLAAYGNPFELIKEAEEELATLPQLATEDMFITEHYFIETSNYGVAVVPIDEIIWIYKYSTMHKVLWHHFAISYTLYITAGKRHYIKCPRSFKSDIDGIMDYLSEANHDILVGFSEENRLKVKKIQNDFSFISDIKEVLTKRV